MQVLDSKTIQAKPVFEITFRFTEEEVVRFSRFLESKSAFSNTPSSVRYVFSQIVERTRGIR